VREKLMKKATIIMLAMALFPSIVNANDRPKSFNNLDFPPKLSISQNQSGWPIYEVESVKYHLYRLLIKPNSPSVTYLLKEQFQTEITDGIEGTRSKTILELWELGTNDIEKRVWRISQQADKWQFSGWDELVLIKYGCCDSPHKYMFYDIKTGSHLRSVESMKLPTKQ
jgi:hypothetical protein